MNGQPDPMVITDPDGNQITIGGLTLADQEAQRDAIQASWQATRNRADLIAKAYALVDLVQSQSQSEIDQYGPTGIAWPPSTQQGVLDRTEVLRQAVLRNDAQKIKLASLLEALVKVLERMIARDVDLVPPDL